MTPPAKPRRFFGLLCAHSWVHTGHLNRQWAWGCAETLPVLTCQHCGDMKVVEFD